MIDMRAYVEAQSSTEWAARNAAIAQRSRRPCMAVPVVRTSDDGLRMHGKRKGRQRQMEGIQ